MKRKLRKLWVPVLSCMLMLAAPFSHAQSLLKEDFTRTTTSNSWYTFYGACLTSSTAAPGSSPGNVPGCVAIGSSYYNQPLTGGVYGDTTGNQTLPDPVGQGALRFTNGAPGGYNQHGAIISGQPYSTANGLNITFATLTYRGDSNGNGGPGVNTNVSDPGYGLPIAANDGADGMSFFLLDGTVKPSDIGSWGGSLGYTCSNINPHYQGMPKAFLALGIDEYGNFLNPHDNTASGPGLQANRIGLRGAGDISFNSLSTNPATSAYYPSALASIAVGFAGDGTTITAADDAVQDTCRTGTIWDYSGVDSAADLSNKRQTNQPILDYAAVPNGYTVLSGIQIADEYASGGVARVSPGVAAIYYRLKISPSGLLSLQYSYNGGAYAYVLQNQSLANVSGTMPASLYFGFAGSTGGSNNIHEILCFQAAPDVVSASSAATSERQGTPLNTTSQSFFAFYNPNDWTGRVTANALSVTSSNQLVIASVPTWDGSCVLTGATASQCSTGLATTAEGPASRQILTWNGAHGVPFQYASLSPTQQSVLTTGDASLNGGAVAAALCAPACRLNYLRGDRSREVNPNGVGLFRDREDVLADIVDSSPVWVGAPNEVLPRTWRDHAHPSSLLTNPYPENTGQSYTAFQTAEQNRTNVVYVGANDGMLHGFRAGSVDASGTLTSYVPNDGYEVMAYVPGSVIASAPTSAASTALGANNCINVNATPTQVQNIHGAVAADGQAAACEQEVLDYSDTQYGHNYFVDATPASGDLFYNGSWHTWLAGTLGYGGSAVYALDVTDPAASGTALTEANAARVVMGEWTAGSITCANVANCGNNMGQSSNAPLIRRLHNGQWGIIFGNGLNSASGDAGIYVIVIPQSGVTAPVAATVYYLTTGVAASGTRNDGINAVTSLDLDGDSIIDYVYGGDVLGNLWRFDLTAVTAGSWAVSSTTPVFKTSSGQPITSRVVIGLGVAGQGSLPQVMVAFGTGEKFPQTNSAASAYLTSAQSLYGFWDWNMSAWNALNPSMSYASLTTAQEAACVPGATLQPFNLANQTVSTATVNGVVTDVISSPATITWPTATCSTSSAHQFGWSIPLIGLQQVTTNEQVISNPLLYNGLFIINSIVPAGSGLLSCKISTDQGLTYAVSILSGAPQQSFFQNYSNDTIGVQYNGSGTPSVVTNSQSSPTATFLLMQTYTGQPTAPPINPPSNILGSRMTWKQLR